MAIRIHRDSSLGHYLSTHGRGYMCGSFPDNAIKLARKGLKKVNGGIICDGKFFNYSSMYRAVMIFDPDPTIVKIKEARKERLYDKVAQACKWAEEEIATLYATGEALKKEKGYPAYEEWLATTLVAVPNIFKKIEMTSQDELSINDLLRLVIFIKSKLEQKELFVK